MKRRTPRRGYAKASRPARIAGVKNRTEQEHEDMYLRPLRASGQVVEWWYEGITLKLGFDLRYTPDFLVLLADGTLEVHEVKGAMVRDDALAKLKMAAALYPLRFVMHQKAPKKLGGAWTRTEIRSDEWTDNEAAA